ncbi:hypothetical protein [Streptomyces sp. WMMC897]|uniref:hypothetical protein n=1 Tax=Streptomyces sp. WMMC897 TaxID=3014782 RepID=UPI0022B62493|nr:hypothetical protein [Streptomyces sp. WMMC897]MCZ7414285.1 hypothetical protein [Streptomyces sp. WMMC897]
MGRPVKHPCALLLQPHGLRRPQLYPCGWRCDRHAPWALAGRPETPPGPGWPAHTAAAETENTDRKDTTDDPQPGPDAREEDHHRT